MSADFSGYAPEPESGARLPQRIRVRAPRRRLSATLSYREVHVDEEIDPETFLLPPPGGARVIDVPGS
jgi:hypothetical protein